MKRDGPKNIVASVQARLVERSRELGVEHQLTLARFGGERLLYRLSKSEFVDRFILKGAALLLMWLGDPTIVGQGKPVPFTPAQSDVQAFGVETTHNIANTAFSVYTVFYYKPGRMARVSLGASEGVLYRRYMPDFMRLAQSVRFD